MISNRGRQKVRKANQARLLSVENSHKSDPKEVDRWVKVKVSMDSGAAAHVMPETMFPRIKLERKTAPKKFLAANGEQIKDLGGTKIPFKTDEGIQEDDNVQERGVQRSSTRTTVTSPQSLDT